MGTHVVRSPYDTILISAHDCSLIVLMGGLECCRVNLNAQVINKNVNFENDLLVEIQKTKAGNVLVDTLKIINISSVVSF